MYEPLLGRGIRLNGKGGYFRFKNMFIKRPKRLGQGGIILIRRDRIPLFFFENFVEAARTCDGWLSCDWYGMGKTRHIPGRVSQNDNRCEWGRHHKKRRFLMQHTRGKEPIEKTDLSDDRNE